MHLKGDLKFGAHFFPSIHFICTYVPTTYIPAFIAIFGVAGLYDQCFLLRPIMIAQTYLWVF